MVTQSRKLGPVGTERCCQVIAIVFSSVRAHPALLSGSDVFPTFNEETKMLQWSLFLCRDDGGEEEEEEDDDDDDEMETVPWCVFECKCGIDLSGVDGDGIILSISFRLWCSTSSVDANFKYLFKPLSSPFAEEERTGRMRDGRRAAEICVAFWILCHVGCQLLILPHWPHFQKGSWLLFWTLPLGVCYRLLGCRGSLTRWYRTGQSSQIRALLNKSLTWSIINLPNAIELFG